MIEVILDCPLCGYREVPTETTRRRVMRLLSHMKKEHKIGLRELQSVEGKTAVPFIVGLVTLGWFKKWAVVAATAQAFDPQRRNRDEICCPECNKVVKKTDFISHLTAHEY